MKKLSSAFTVGLLALISVGCNNANDTAKTQLAPETNPEAQDTVLAELEVVDDHSDNSSEVLEPSSEFNEIETPLQDIIPLETEEQAVTEVDNIVAELDVIVAELDAIDDLLADF